MNHSDLNFIASLDPHKSDGTIQSFLMMAQQQGVESVSFEEFLKKIVVALKGEKDYLIKDNIKLSLNGGKLE